MRQAPVCCALALALAFPAFAQMPDPTEPPAAMRPAPAGTAGGVEAEPAAGPRLQSVLISTRRRVAVIDGHTVRQGQQHRGALVASITPTQVVLVRGSAKEVLKLYPAAPANARSRQR